MPPLTPSKILATVFLRSPRPALEAVPRLDLALRDLLQCDRQVVLRRGLDHRRGKLLENSLAERVVVVVDLPRPLRRHDHRSVVRIDVVQQAVNARINQRLLLLAPVSKTLDPRSRPSPLLAPPLSAAARP